MLLKTVPDNIFMLFFEDNPEMRYVAHDYSDIEWRLQWTDHLWLPLLTKEPIKQYNLIVAGRLGEKCYGVDLINVDRDSPEDAIAQAKHIIKEHLKEPK